MFSTSRIATAVVFAALVCGWTSGARAAEIATVALTGDVAPGTGGAFLNQIVGDPVVNGAGEVSFRALLAGSGVTGANDEGIWVGKPGDLALVVREGDRAPGAGEAVFTGFLGDAPLLNGAGDVAFKALIAGNGVTGANDKGIWVGKPGGLALVVREGDRAPGARGAVFKSFPGESLLLNGSGEVAFVATLKGSDVTKANDKGIWVGKPGDLTFAVREGDRASGASGSVFKKFSHLVLNGAGELAFFAELTGGKVTRANDEGVWAGKPSRLRLVAREGDRAPGAGGAKFRNTSQVAFGPPVLNGIGEVAFWAGVRGGGARFDEGVWVGKPGSLALVARAGDPAPGSGKRFNWFANVRLNGAGEVAFEADLPVEFVFDDVDRGIWAGKPGALVLVARFTGSPDGGSEFAVPFRYLNLNGVGEVAIVDSDPDSARDALWAGAPGDLQLIIGEGDAIEVAPSDLRTVADFPGIGFKSFTGNEDGERSAFSEGGQVAFRASFTDDSSGVFLSPPDPPKVHRIPSRAINGSWEQVMLPRSFTDPVIIAGPPTIENKQPGVVRLRKVKGAKGRFQARFQEWSYLNGKHPEERTDFLVLEQGRHLLADGSIWEAGTVRVRRTGGGSGPFRSFTTPFPGAPRVFLTVQPSRTAFAAATRAYDVTPAGFRVRADDPQRGPRIQVLVTYTVGYLAVFSSSGQGKIAGGVNGTDYRLKQAEVNHRFKRVLGERIKLQEERSKDKETRHKKETVSVMTLGRGLFAQQASNRERDTTALRRR